MSNARIYAVLALVLGTAVLLFGREPADQSAITVVRSGDGVNIFFEGTLRLAGGRPRFQSMTPSIVDVEEEDSGFVFQTVSKPITLKVQRGAHAPVVILFLSPGENRPVSGSEFLGFLFDEIPEFQEGVAIWRYKPWNSWTKPIRVNAVREMEEWDVQFFYWKYADGLYGAAVPLSGHGYRTTLGREGTRFGSKSVSYFDGVTRDSIPQMAVGFGRDPYRLIETIYEEALTSIGHPENLRKHKAFPDILKSIGWCSWNASGMGKNLNEQLLLDVAKDFASGKFPVRWLMVDDGWFDHTNNRLNSFSPLKEKFPLGFRSVIDKLKHEYQIKDVGVWHAYNGYWQGINPESELGRKYRGEMFSWQEKISPDEPSSGLRTCSFISPYSKALPEFYRSFHSFLKQQGFSFVKVDNQLITERMAPGNFPIWDGAEKFHAALNASVAKTFNNTIINCMDMTADAYQNFGSTAVGRGVEDYFPYEQGENFNLQRGNAAAHVLQAVYNALYFSQMVYPDFDHFESTNPNAVFHAIARALNDGPIYITDEVGKHRFDVLAPLVLSDGTIIRPDRPLLPAEDCLFQVQEARPFKAFSMSGQTGLLGIWNCADADSVEGFFSPSDVHPLEGEKFAVYEYFSKKLLISAKGERFPVKLKKLDYRLYYCVPLVEGNAVLGLVNKYNGPGTIVDAKVSAYTISVVLLEGGAFAAVTAERPRTVRVDGFETSFSYAAGLLSLDIPVREDHQAVRVEIALK